MRIVVTGGCGFMGSAFIRHLLRDEPDTEIVNFDKLTYAADPRHLDAFAKHRRVTFFQGDIVDSQDAARAVRQADVVVNFAAESHNDRGFVDPSLFTRTNVLGTQVLLEACRAAGVRRFHQISTCEVFGDLPLEGAIAFDEAAPCRPTSPYSASKAAADMLVLAYGSSFGLHVTVSRSCNNYGPWQASEKVIPRFILAAIHNLPLPVFRSSHHRREWVHVSDHSAAVHRIVRRGAPGSVYNIGTGIERSVSQLADLILRALSRPASLRVVVPDRPRHDRRYVLNCDRIRRDLGWSPLVAFDAGLRETVAWYEKHRCMSLPDASAALAALGAEAA